MKITLFVAFLAIIQALSAFFFLSDIVMTVLGLNAQPIRWQTHELLQIGASIGLVAGFVLGSIALMRTVRRGRQVEDKLRVLSSAFRDMMDERFDGWGLTPAERDVALFAIKGLSTAEIAALRQTSEGTVKAQTNSIYRKAGVNGRAQLLSLFIEDLMDGSMLERAGIAPAPSGDEDECAASRPAQPAAVEAEKMLEPAGATAGGQSK